MVAYPIPLYLAAVALFKGINGGAAFSELAIPASATRWGACLALFVWLWFDRKSSSGLKAVYIILILAVSLTFFAHGYEAFKTKLGEALGKPVASGEFGAMMDVALINSGPVTIVMDSKVKD